MRLTSLLLSVVLVSSNAIAAPELAKSAAKAPWQLSLEERLALRFQPATVSRLRTAKASAAAGDSYTIDGKRNPELLLPHELFSRLIKLGFAPDDGVRSHYRQDFGAAAVRRGLGDDFWPRLETAARDLLRSRAEERTVSSQLQPADPDRREELLSRIHEIQKPQCALRAAALLAARQAFGEDVFDEFLYSVVAPTTTVTTFGGSFTAQAARRIEEGCP